MDGHIGPYEVLGRLGAGGMGEVYRARDPRLRRDVAIKRLVAGAESNDERRRALLREARSAARITHQNVAALHDVLEDGDDLYLVMELVEGETLDQRCARSNSVDTVLDLAIQCAAGLAAAHAQGLIHGDVKPDNIMVTAQGQAKILDFGVARPVAAAEADSETQALGEGSDSGVAGTLLFMAPETLLGQRFDHRADIFSFGVTLYRMLTGVHPFAAATGPATVDQILHHQPQPIARLNPQLPDSLAPILDKMLAKSADRRYATVADLLVDLRAARARLTTDVGKVADSAGLPPVVAAPTARRAPWIWAMVAFLAVAVVAAVVWQQGSTPVASPTGAAARFDPADWVIAVLATPGDGNDDEMRALTDGMAATLTGKLTQMSRAHSLQVIPATSLRERGVQGPGDARRDFGVTLAIDFQLRRIGDRLRVNVNLIDTRQERQLDAVTVDGSIDDPIDLEEQVALRALRMLRIELLPMEQGLLEAGTAEPRAHGYYLRAKGYLQEYADPTSVAAAADLLEQALRVDPGYARAHAALGEALWNRYRLTEDVVWVARAAAACQTAVDLAPDDADGYRCLGTVYDGTGRAAEAAQQLERARRLDPTNDATYIALGSAYQNAGQLDDAESTYEEAVALRPHYWGGYSWLGVFYLRQGRNAEAIRNLEQVVQLAPDSYRGFSNLGAAYYRASEWQSARQAFERALTLNPEYVAAISNIATLHFFEGNYAEAAVMYERAVALPGAGYLHWGNLGDAYYWATGERARATEAYGRAIELATIQLAVNPNDAEINQHMARYYVMTGDGEAARAHLDRAMELAPGENDVLHAAAQVYLVLGDRDRSFEYLREAVDRGYQRAEIALDPLFAEVRQDPRYLAIMDDQPAAR